MSSPSIYAELLLNICQITLLVVLPSNCDGTTELELSPDRTSISVTHDSEHAEAKLPCQVADNVSLKVPQIPAKELLYRLSLDEASNMPSKPWIAQGDQYLWPASSMTPDTQIACRSCLKLISNESLRAWNALPSENWAEMMDFWHCHKPDSEGAQPVESQGLAKGYSAFNRLGPTSGIGLVDTTSFLLQRDDCVNIKVCL